jgi:hypothetical protein
VEQELAAGLGEGQIAEFVEDDEVHAGQMFGEPTQMFGEPTLRLLRVSVSSRLTRSTTL